MKDRKRQQGQSLVEFALLFPILILIVLGIADLGRAYYALVTLNDAAEEGAMYAAISPDPTNSAEREKIRDRAAHATSGLINADDLKQNWDQDSVVVGGDTVTVTVEYDFQVLTPIMQSFFGGGTVTLRGRAVNAVIVP